MTSEYMEILKKNVHNMLDQKKVFILLVSKTGKYGVVDIIIVVFGDCSQQLLVL